MELFFDIAFDSCSINGCEYYRKMIETVEKSHGDIVSDIIEPHVSKKNKFTRIITVGFETTDIGKCIKFLKIIKNLKKFKIEAIYQDEGKIILIYASSLYQKKHHKLSQAPLVKYTEIDKYLLSKFCK